VKAPRRNAGFEIQLAVRLDDHLAVDSQGQTIWIADAHRGDGPRFVVRADEKLTAFLELESAIRDCGG
jgi:hypothetical protein